MDLTSLLESIDIANYNTDMDYNGPTFINECITLNTIDDIMYKLEYEGEDK